MTGIRTRGIRATAFALVALLICAPAWSQSISTPATGDVSALPEPYTKDEFPSWATGLRRFEIVSLGAFPLLLFYTRFAFDMKRYIDNGFDSTYAPWPFKNESSIAITDEDQVTNVLTAAGLSLVFGAIDAFLVFRADLK